MPHGLLGQCMSVNLNLHLHAQSIGKDRSISANQLCMAHDLPGKARM